MLRKVRNLKNYFFVFLSRKQGNKYVQNILLAPNWIYLLHLPMIYNNAIISMDACACTLLWKILSWQIN
jgi:hypothetical protein